MNNDLSKVKLTRRQTERHRASIKTGEIIARLQRAVLGRVNEAGEQLPAQEMSSTQIKAAELLLNKSLPTLSNVVQETHQVPYSGATEEELVERLSSWLQRNPALLAALAQRGITIDATAQPQPAITQDVSSQANATGHGNGAATEGHEAQPDGEQR